MTTFDYITRAYGVPACIGRRITIHGKPATITSDLGHYIGITYDTDKPGVIRNAHPTDGVVYFDAVVKPRRASRSARRYADYLRAEASVSFAEWLRITGEAKP
jgi:hypothetical protein